MLSWSGKPKIKTVPGKLGYLYNLKYWKYLKISLCGMPFKKHNFLPGIKILVNTCILKRIKKMANLWLFFFEKGGGAISVLNKLILFRWIHTEDYTGNIMVHNGIMPQTTSLLSSILNQCHVKCTKYKTKQSSLLF